jgi:hypothetical protein
MLTNSRATVVGIGTNNWTGDFNQEWVITSQGNHTYRVGPRTAWWRVLVVDETSHIIISNNTMDDFQHWIFNSV